jgi:hypothetical protein
MPPLAIDVSLVDRLGDVLYDVLSEVAVEEQQRV